MDKMVNSLFRKANPALGTEATTIERLRKTGISIDYSDIGVTPYGIDAESLGARQSPRTLAISQDMKIERTPYLNPTAVSKGTVSSGFGGITEFRDINGGTLLTYDPVSGTITITGGVLINQTVNVGTLYNSVLTGTINNIGTINLGMAQSGTLSGIKITSGTFNNINIGTSQLIGGSIGTASFVGGTVQASSIEGGTILSAMFSGTPLFSILSGSSQLSTSGNMQFQTYGTGVALMVNLGGTTFRFMPTGTI